MKVIFNEAITYRGKADISYLAELIPAATSRFRRNLRSG